MKPTDFEDENEPGFFKRNLVMLIIGGIALGGSGYMLTNYKPSKSAPKKKLDMVMIMPVLPPPPPPPPPPPKEEPPPPEEKEEQMIEQPPEEIADKPDDKPADEPKDEPLGTAIAGGDGSGLGIGSGGGNRGMIGGGKGNGGSKWGWYAGTVQTRIAEALRKHPLTRRAGFSNVVKIWSDSTGRIIRVRLSSSTGDRAVDSAIENEVLNGLVLNEPPPDDMPMPINLRLSARQPN
ncbi:TonB C-terminal domain-containing protein [Prosthecobacter sp.]|uniref:TonB C-terminal domain-containing protein n=1 Tax=Prosthecobacter sp. TaxID=1965333 RepID=UPI0024874C99|nr:TonB C-terminal domain-containing protein [Prosthecobacter sp.]MDI1315357.1 TonB C-terminal domain-containing protein [Prosthecobacter sp.]